MYNIFMHDVFVYISKMFCSPKITIIFAFVNVCGVKSFMENNVCILYL